MPKVKLEVVYKRKTKTGAICEECGKYSPNPTWIGFNEGEIVTEAPFGSCCSRKYKIKKEGPK